MSEEIFRIKYKSPEAYNLTKVIITADEATLGLAKPLFTFDDATNSIVSDQSHFYLKTLLRGTETAKALKLDQHTYDYFTNACNDQSLFTVVPNIEGYKARRQEALDFYASRPTPPEPPALSVDPGNATSREVVSNLLSYPKSSIGDYHQMNAPKAALINNMKGLKDTNTTLLLEHLFVLQRPMLDAYVNGDGHIAPEIGRYSENRDKLYDNLGKNGAVGILQAAHKYGVPVVGIEDGFSMDAGAFGAISPLPGMKLEGDEKTFNTHDRVLLMNSNAIRVAEALEAQGVRTLTFAGGAHVTDQAYEGAATIPGLARSFGSPKIEIHNKPLAFEETSPAQGNYPIFYYNPEAPEPLRSRPALAGNDNGHAKNVRIEISVSAPSR